jgi:hypothetical protein
MLRALRALVVLLVVVLALAFGIAYLYRWLGDVSSHRAFSLVFYVGGGVLLLFALLTRGAESRAYDLGRGVGLMRRFSVRPEERALNPTGAFVVAALVLLVLGGVFDTVL